jgi:hypothetical protein
MNVSDYIKENNKKKVSRIGHTKKIFNKDTLPTETNRRKKTNKYDYYNPLFINKFVKVVFLRKKLQKMQGRKKCGHYKLILLRYGIKFNYIIIKRLIFSRLKVIRFYVGK